ncbi:MAG: CHRD domain-containing protein [Gemmatimonadales bacterium]
MRRMRFFAAALYVAVALGACAASAAPVTLTAALTAEEEAPTPGPAGAKGTAELNIDSAAGQLCYKLTHEGIGTPTAAHIHKGPAGVAGPVVVNFDYAANGDRACVSVNGSQLAGIVGDPGGHYVNIHTADYPQGAIRGQLTSSS